MPATPNAILCQVLRSVVIAFSLFQFSWVLSYAGVFIALVGGLVGILATPRCWQDYILAYV